MATRAAAFDLEMAKGQLAEERSKARLLGVQLANKSAELTELAQQRTAARQKLGQRAEAADALHEKLRVAALAQTDAWLADEPAAREAAAA